MEFIKIHPSTLFQKTIVCIAFLGICTFGYSQNDSRPVILKKINTYLEDYHEKVPMPGFSVVIVEGDKVIFQKGYGLEKLGGSKPMTVKSSTGIGDLCNSFTALAIMQLVEAGKLNLDDKVTKYLPWFQTANKHYSDQITIRMLLSNTAGIPGRFESFPSLDYENALENFVRSMDSYYITKEPGLSFEYSREGFSVAGLIISKVSGLSYAKYLEKNIFEPLQMNRSTTDPARFDALQVLYGHEIGLTECIPAKPGMIDGNYLPAGSELRSSAQDLGNYLIALVNDGKFGGKQIISKESIKEMWKPHTSFSGLGTMLGGDGSDVKYCLGWLEMNIDDRDVILHLGNTNQMSSICGIHPDKKLAIALLFNADSGRMNRYEYPNIQNISNNIIHLLSNEPLTEFANPRFDDPTENDYDLPADKWGKYIGRYISIGEAHPFFKDYTLEISVGETDSLELKSFKEGNLKGHFKLDFSNESRAVLRGIVDPEEIVFKIYPNGSIGGLFMFGSEFKKKDAAMDSRFALESTTQESLTFLFPKAWKGHWNGNEFSATLPEKPDTKLNLKVSPIQSKDFKTLQAEYFKNQPIQTKGIQKKESVNEGIWTEQSLAIEQNEQLTQYLFVLYQDPISSKQLQLVLSNPWGGFSIELQEMLMYFQKSVHF